MPSPPSPGQVACQGGRGHHWDPIPTPQGYKSLWYLTVHMRCDSCGTVKRVHLDSYGRQQPAQYIRAHDWVKYSLDDAPSGAQKRLAYYRKLPPEYVSRKNGRK